MAYGVIDKTRVPHGGVFRCSQPGLNSPITHPYYHQTFVNVQKFRLANGLPKMSAEEFEACVCAEMPDICGEVEIGEEAPRTLGERILKFSRSLHRWAAMGFAMVSPEVYADRWKTCSGAGEALCCPEWNGEAYFGMGKCGACGCTRLKLFAASEKCPLGKWAA